MAPSDAQTESQFQRFCTDLDTALIHIAQDILVNYTYMRH